MSDLLEVNRLKAFGMSAEVSFKLAAEEWVILFGPSGTGKSVLLRALADLIPHSGEVSLDAQAQDSMCPEHWRRQVMYFPAETAWWRETVEEHFDVLPSEEQLQSIGLRAEHLKRTINSLSSGEKQRLALLRGLLYLPKVLLLDEITANLDPESTAQVEQLLQEYVKEHRATVLWVSHDEMQSKRLASDGKRWNILELYERLKGESR
ncbi:ATP-binding cassette domain-containing protein [Thiomicrorhabdus sp.]|uniref:ABC transporter ATP-binding protein n=1 Tax=Thiomicrorhabdus sp. TaxID=2039724 RepID=UPI003567A93A